MTKYDYRVVFSVPMDEKDLRRYGDDGWLLCAIRPAGMTDAYHFVRVVSDG